MKKRGERAKLPEGFIPLESEEFREHQMFVQNEFDKHRMFTQLSVSIASSPSNEEMQCIKNLWQLEISVALNCAFSPEYEYGYARILLETYGSDLSLMAIVNEREEWVGIVECEPGQ